MKLGKKKWFMWSVFALALIGALVHLLPDTLTQLVQWGFGYATLQRTVGLLTILGLGIIGWYNK